jgi:quercetin dioxygenase-like cupin family protein
MPSTQKEHDGMEDTRLDRRLLLMAMGAISAGRPLGGVSDAAAFSSGGRVLDAGRGEHLVHFRDGGDIFIFVGADTGTDTVALGTQQIKARGGIPVHRHLHMEEAFYVIDGSGECLLDDVPHPVSRGASIFIPRNTWHGFKTPTDDLLVLWIMAPGGLDGFFRETCSPPGAAPKKLSADQIRQIAKKYGIEFR